MTDQTLGDLIDAGVYRKIACEFWKKFTVGNKDYGPVITAIALLGEEITRTWATSFMRASSRSASPTISPAG